MKISQATALIRTPLIEWLRPQDWCDLGCGTGTFTTALAQLLAPGSTIDAVDLDQKALEEIPDRYAGVQIRKIPGITVVLSYQMLDPLACGITL